VAIKNPLAYQRVFYCAWKLQVECDALVGALSAVRRLCRIERLPRRNDSPMKGILPGYVFDGGMFSNASGQGSGTDGWNCI
jgi:hypothetical protein